MRACIERSRARGRVISRIGARAVRTADDRAEPALREEEVMSEHRDPTAPSLDPPRREPPPLEARPGTMPPPKVIPWPPPPRRVLPL